MSNTRPLAKKNFSPFPRFEPPSRAASPDRLTTTRPVPYDWWKLGTDKEKLLQEFLTSREFGSKLQADFAPPVRCKFGPIDFRII